MKVINNNVQESYCLFEVSKLLKEKGFDCLCNTHYSYGSGDINKDLDKLVYIGGFVDDDGNNRPYKNSELANWKLPYGEFSRPTHTLAKDWIELNFGIWIEIFWDVVDSEENNVLNWNYAISKIGNMEFENIIGRDFTSYQEATEAALKYTLQNLIPAINVSTDKEQK